MARSGKENQGWMRTMGMVGNLGFQIAVPLVVLTLIGRALDQHFESSPWLTIAGIFLSLFLTSFLVLRKIQSLMKEMEEGASPKNDQRQNSKPSS